MKIEEIEENIEVEKNRKKIEKKQKNSKERTDACIFRDFRICQIMWNKF